MADPRAFAYLTPNPAQRSDRLVIREFEVHMAPFRHDLARMVIQGPTDIDTTMWDTGVPALVQYGRFPTTVGTFYGYVLATSRSWDQTLRAATRDRTMEVLAIGASWPLKDGISAVYNGMTSAQIAREIIASNYFDIDAPDTQYVWPAKNTGGTSTWAFLCELAKVSGLTCHMAGTRLRFYDPMTVLRRAQSAVPVFHEKDSGQGQTVLSISTDNSEAMSDGGRRKRTRTVQGIDIRTGAPIYSTDDGSTTLGPFIAQRYRLPTFTEQITDLVPHDQSAASELLAPRMIENRFNIRARASLAGDTRVLPESPVVLEGLGPRDAGLWQVLEVTHKVHKHWYSLECELGRDSDYDNGIRPGPPIGVSRPRFAPYETTVFNDPPTVLINDRWRAAWNSQKAA